MEHMAIVDTLKDIERLAVSDPSQHLFCANEQRRKNVLDSLQIFGYDGGDAVPFQQMLVEKFDAQLGGCVDCILCYYQARSPWIHELRESHDEEEVENFIGLLNSKDNARIIRGLDGARKTLEELPVASRRIVNLQGHEVMAIFEALTSEPFLNQDVLLKDHFNTTFELVQTHKPLLVSFYVPALTQFLFSDIGSHVQWATTNWRKSLSAPKEKSKAYIGEMSVNDFEFAVHRPLTRVMERLNDQLSNNWRPEMTSQRLLRFWQGLNLIVDRMSSETITHGLRAMDVSVYRFLLDWLHFCDQAALLPLLSTTKGLLSKGPKDFWDALGAIASKSVIEGIFTSPPFLPTLASIKQIANNSELPILLGWIEPLMASLQIAHKSEACLTLTDHLLSKLQTKQYSNEVRTECYRVGLRVLSTALSECCAPEFSFNGVGKVVAANIVGNTAKYIEDIVSPLNTATVHQELKDIVAYCKDVLELSLKLECTLLHQERHEIHNLEKLEATFRVSELRIWPAVDKVFSRDMMELAPICLQAITNFVALEPLESKIANLERQRQRQDFNSVLQIAYGHIDKILQTLGIFQSASLASLLAQEEFTANLIKALFLSSDGNYSNALDLVKSISGASFRREALGYLIEKSFDSAIRAMLWSCYKIAKAKAFYSTSRMMKIMKNALDMLCNDQDGILKNKSITEDSCQLLQHFWTGQWDVVRIVYSETPGWAVHHKIAPMQEFCRDVMDFSELLFDQFATIESAVQQYSMAVNSDIPGDEKVVSKDFHILEGPSNTFYAMAQYLKLRDEYLLSVCVKLTWKLLTELTKRDIELPARSSSLLQTMLKHRSATKTNLTSQQKAEISRLLEENLGHPLEISREQSENDAEPAPLKAKQPVARQGVIDVVSWSSRAKEDTNVETKTRPRESVAKPPIKTSLPAIPSRTTKPNLAQQKNDADGRAAFLKKREEAQKDKKRRDAEAAARAKKRLPDTIAGLTAGEGSALGNLGNLSREQVKKGSDIMVDSDTEDDDEEDEWSMELFGKGPKTSAAVDAYNANKRLQAAKVQEPVKKIKQVRTRKDLRARVAPDLSPIHGIILGWNFFHDGDFPPGSARNDYSLVTSKFITAHEYRKTFEPLLLLEAWQSFRQSREDTNEKVHTIKVGNRMNQDNLVVISVTTDMLSDRDRLSEGDILLLSKADHPSKSPESPNCLARVFKTNRKAPVTEITMRIGRANPLLDSIMPNSTLRCEKVNSIVPLEREYGALLGLEYYDLCDEIVKAYPSPLMKYNDSVLSKTMGNYNLNKAQASAVKSSVDNDGFTLIQGPPGSGKTKTVVAIVGALLSDVLVDNKAVAIAAPISIGSGSAQNRAVPKKLLICAPSNAAVDELVMRFMQGVKTQHGDLRKPSIVRLGRSDNVNSKVLEVTLDELVKKKMDLAEPEEKGKGMSETQKTMLEHKATCDEINATFLSIDDMKKRGQGVSSETSHKLDVLQRKKQQLGNRIDNLKDAGNTSARNAEITKNKVRQEIVDGAHILCATLSGSGHDMFRNLSLDFDTVIIDEAAQSIELSALIPLKYGCSKCIMVGDPKQLPPTVLSREASRFQYEQSLFVRMQANSPDNVHLLDTQYRMHPEISIFPSKTFYDGRLLDGPNMAALTAKPWHADPILGPYRFFDVQGMHQSGPVGHSLINRAEIDIALKLFQRLRACASGYSFSGKVGIITPYKSQLNALKQTFSNKFGEDILKVVDFNTTDAFQGRESEVIIFSCVRASGKGIGFLSDIRRMNVGITRAKSSLWVLGNSSNLVQGEFWSKMIEDARARDRFTTNIETAISQPVIRVNIEAEKYQKKPLKIEQNSSDVKMGDAPDVKDDISARRDMSIKLETPINDLQANGNKKRSAQSPVDDKVPKLVKKEEKVDLKLAKSRGKVDTDSALPKVSGNSALSPKVIVPTSTAAPRPPANGVTLASTTSGNRPPQSRPPQRPAQPKKTAAELAFIQPKRKPSRR